MRYIFYLFVIVSLCCTSCASSYRQINPLRIAYHDSVASRGLAVEYRYDVLRQAGNKKYARKADDKKIKIVALKVTNHTQEDVYFGEDIDIFSDDQRIVPLAPDVVRREVKQVSGLYMIWSIFWLTFTKCENDDCSITPIPVGFLIGLGNTLGASAANKNFHRELEYHDMMKKIIKPGETVKGLLVIRSESELPLDFFVK